MEVYFRYIRDADGVKKAYEDLRRERFLGFDTETTELDPYRGDLRLLQLSNGRNTHVIDLKPFSERGNLHETAELAPIREILGDPAIVKIAHNAKFDTKWVRHHLGCEINGVFDTYLFVAIGCRKHDAKIFWHLPESGRLSAGFRLTRHHRTHHIYLNRS